MTFESRVMMNQKRMSLAFKIAAGYFLFVVLLTLWYVASLDGRHGGTIQGLALVFVTFPAVLFSGWFVGFLGCAQNTACEPLAAPLFAGSINAVLIYVVLRALAARRNASINA